MSGLGRHVAHCAARAGTQTADIGDEQHRLAEPFADQYGVQEQRFPLLDPPRRPDHPNSSASLRASRARSKQSKALA